MSDKFITSAVTILLAIIGVAIIALLVSKSSNTSGVLTSGSSGFSSILCTALSPLGVCNRQLVDNVNSNVIFEPM